MVRSLLAARITISNFNPYESPNPIESPATDSAAIPPPQSVGWVKHVRIVSALMIAQGSLDLLMGAGLIAMGAFVGFGMRNIVANDPEFQRNAPPPDAMFTLMSWGYIAVGVVTSLIGAVNIFAGIRNWMFKGRILGMVAMFLGLGASFTCYCLPTSVGILVYGLIVYLNPAVIRAFQMRAEGYTVNDALAVSPPTSPPQSSSPP